MPFKGRDSIVHGGGFKFDVALSGVLNNPQVCEASRDEALERVRECLRHSILVQNASMVVVLMVAPTWMLLNRLVCIVGMTAL